MGDIHAAERNRSSVFNSDMRIVSATACQRLSIVHLQSPSIGGYFFDEWPPHCIERPVGDVYNPLTVFIISAAAVSRRVPSCE